jgi:hypothetical protein
MAVSEGNYERLLGVWRLVSAQIQNEATGEVRDLHGPDPRGFAIFSPEGRVSIIITASKRTPPKSDAEAATLFRGISAYTGRFTIEANKVVTEVDAAWHPAWEDTRQPRFYELDGDSLTLRTELQDHPSYPGWRLRGVVVWMRDR